MTPVEIKCKLLAMQDIKYRDFSQPLIPGAKNIMGVRLPDVDRLAQEIAKGDWRHFLENADNEYMEEVMLQGMVIGYAKADIEEILTYVARFIPQINNWAICDSFCNRLKITRKYPKRMWVFLQPYLCSDKEYEIRYGLVMLLGYFINGEYIDSVLKAINQVRLDGYYVKMAAAWALSVAYIKFPEPTLSFLQQNQLDDFTFNKTLQKICDSFRVSKEAKTFIRAMKRR